MNNWMETIFGLLGGLAIFIFGMNMMSECLQKAAGKKMQSILALLTRNPILGVLAGALTTAVLQSSSATTVMAIGFVSAGLMSLPQAISIIFGANIGTTVTAQLLTLKISDYIYVIIFIGFLLQFLAKSERVKSIAQTVFAFGLLFLGIETMGDVMKPLASSPFLTSMIAQVTDIPILGVLVGTLMTLVVQSSSATIAVLQNFASQAGPDGVTSIIGLAGAIPILLGDNIGTTITAILACIGQNKDAKRTAVAHCIFNISGAFLFIWLIRPFAAFIRFITFKGPEVEVISSQIANAHTTFNIIMTLIWLPLIGVLVKMVMKLIPSGDTANKTVSHPLYLDDKLLGQPVAALSLVSKEILRCGSIVQHALHDTLLAVEQEEPQSIHAALQNATDADTLNDHINEYLSDLFSKGVLTEEQATQASGMMYVLADIDRIGLLCKDVIQSVQEKIDQHHKYSKDAIKDLKRSLALIAQMYDQALQSATGDNHNSVENFMAQKDKIMKLSHSMRKDHMKRVAAGKCKASMTTPFNRILHSIDRMGNSCMNIASASANDVNFHYFL